LKNWDPEEIRKYQLNDKNFEFIDKKEKLIFIRKYQCKKTEDNMRG
jgi:hypothetical protein